MLLVVMSVASCDFVFYPYDDEYWGGSSGIGLNPESLTVEEDPRTGLYGYLNQYGQWVIDPIYRYARNFDTEVGLAVVSVYGNFYGAIDVYARTVIEFRFRGSSDVLSAIRSIKNGRYRGIDLWAEEDGEGLYGYLDYYGEWYIEPQYLDAGTMNEEGLAVVQFLDGMWGVIDRNNNIVILPNFTSRSGAAEALRYLMSSW